MNTTDTHYHRTGYCSRCDRHYGQHIEGCTLAGVTPECMVPLADRKPADPFAF